MVNGISGVPGVNAVKHAMEHDTDTVYAIHQRQNVTVKSA